MLGTHSQIDQNKTSAADINTSSLSQNMPLGQSLESWNQFYFYMLMYSKKGMETICENFNVDYGG